jgi:hypothetical protein
MYVHLAYVQAKLKELNFETLSKFKGVAIAAPFLYVKNIKT